MLPRISKGVLKRGLSRHGPAAVVGGVVDIASNWRQRGRRIDRDGRRNKKWRKVRNRALRPVLRTLLRTNPITGLLAGILRL